MLGLAMKAGKVATGEFSTEKAVKSKKAYLVVVANDASDNTKKNFQNMCRYYKISLKYYASKEMLGHACGKHLRASLAITDKGLADQIVRNIEIYENMEV